MFHLSNTLFATNFKKKHLHICLVLENLLFQESNGIVAILLLIFLHFIIYYVTLINHINFQMLRLETLISIDFQSLILFKKNTILRNITILIIYNH